jgi:hypothetical protein
MPETDNGRKMYFWLQGFVASVLVEAGTDRHEQIMGELADMLCDIESETRAWERDQAFAKAKGFANLMFELAEGKVNTFAGEGGDAYYAEEIREAFREVVDNQRQIR